MRMIFILSLIVIYSINTDNYMDMRRDQKKCRETNKDNCISTKLKTKDLECCSVTITDVSDGTDSRLCLPFPPTFASIAMAEQIYAVAREVFGILFVYTEINVPKTREEIICKSARAIYELGDYTYTSQEIQKLKSEKHCLYYFYDSIGQNFLNKFHNKGSVSIDKDKCINAEILDTTSEADIYCAYVELHLRFLDGTKSDFYSCSFLPSKSISTKRLDDSTEDTLKSMASYEASRNNKQIEEYNATLVDKKGRSITYNSLKGVIATSEGKNLPKICYLLILGFFFL